MTEWRPIDTAPKDGTRILLFFPQWRCKMLFGHYTDSERREHGKVTDRHQGWHVEGIFMTLGSDPDPSHWMPLPDPPA